jgi:tol-pal system protein YbgF
MKQLQNTVDQNDTLLKGLVERMSDQVNNLSSGMSKITQAVDSIGRSNDKVSGELRGAIANVNTTLGELQKDMSSVRTQIDAVSKQITALQTTTEPLAGPDDLWRDAGLDAFTGNYSLAVSGYQEFLSKYPQDPRALDAHLNLGDALSNLKQYDQAIFEYDIVLQKYPENDKTKTALLKKGLAQAELKQPQATNTLNEVVKRFPKTSEARTAEAKLRELRAPAQRGR